MSDTAIFVVGGFAFLLLSGGLTFTVLDVRRLGQEAEAREESNRPSLPESRTDRA
jgi:hypothetical protein